MTERIHCPRCRMSFRVEAPSFTGCVGFWTHCSEPGCGRRFWFKEGGRKIVCGVDPKSNPHGPRMARERAVPHIGAPVVALAVERACLPVTTAPAPAAARRGRRLFRGE